jgi:hypothetical protein
MIRPGLLFGQFQDDECTTNIHTHLHTYIISVEWTIGLHPWGPTSPREAIKTDFYDDKSSDIGIAYFPENEKSLIRKLSSV